MTSPRRFPPLWKSSRYRALDASGQALAYVYARETREQAGRPFFAISPQ
jgi:hypothetical protein